MAPSRESLFTRVITDRAEQLRLADSIAIRAGYGDAMLAWVLRTSHANRVVYSLEEGHTIEPILKVYGWRGEQCVMHWGRIEVVVLRRQSDPEPMPLSIIQIPRPSWMLKESPLYEALALMFLRGAFAALRRGDLPSA